MKLLQAAAAALGLFAASLNAQALELLMFNQEGCAWCERWEREAGGAYAKTSEGQAAPLRRIHIRDQASAGVALDLPVRFTPTFVLADQGREIARITGYQDNAMFWGLLNEAVKKAGK